jgi:hypothetical protein
MSKGAVVLIVVLVVLLLGGDAVIDRLTNGSRVGPRTELRDDGLVDGNPIDLATAAGLDLDTYSLARALSSEHGQDPDAYLVAVGWAIRNYAVERGSSVFAVLTDGAGDAGDWLFGEQKAAAGTKYASTAQDPFERHVTAAVAVISGATPDPTDGATHFFSPRAQDNLSAKAAAGDTRFAKYAGKDAASVDARWRAPGGLYPEGAVPVVPPGVDGRVLTLYRRAGV